MKRLAVVVLIYATGALATAGRTAVWLDVRGSVAYRLVESARTGFAEGLVEAGLNLVPREEVTSINTVIDPADDAQLAQLASALECDYAASVSVGVDGEGVEIRGVIYDPYAGRRHEGSAVLAEDADGARMAAKLLAEEITRSLPSAGPLISLDESWMTALMALGAGDGIGFNDYLWVYRYGEPLIHPDTGAILGVDVKVIGAGRVEEVRGDHLSLVSLSPSAAGLEYEPSDRVRMFEEDAYGRFGFARGTVIPFSVIGFGEAGERPVPLPQPPIHPRGPEGIEVVLEESLALDYSPLSLDASFEGVTLLGDDERLHLLPLMLQEGPERVIEVAGDGPATQLGREVYLADPWEGTVIKVGTETGDESVFDGEIGPDLLISGEDGYLWAVVFSYFNGPDLVSYPALRFGPGGDVLEVRELDAGRLNDAAVAPDGTIYYTADFEPVRGRRSDGITVEIGARMLPEPKALDTDPLGWLYVVDQRMGLVVFDEEQRVMGTWNGIDFRNVNLIAVADNGIYLASGWDQMIYRLSYAYVY